MKKQLFLLIIGFFLISSCSSTKNAHSFKQDQFDAVNDFLETQIKKETDTIVIIKEKIKNEETIEIFHGDYITYPDTSYVRREGGVEPPLYNKKDWLKMEKNNSNKGDDPIENTQYWNENDFKYKKIEFISNDELRKNIISKKYIVGTDIEKKAYIFSNPISYKKKYLTFTVFETTTKFFGLNPRHYIVVMEKRKDKWIVLQKVYSNVMY